MCMRPYTESKYGNMKDASLDCNKPTNIRLDHTSINRKDKYYHRKSKYRIQNEKRKFILLHIPFLLHKNKIKSNI